MVGVGLDGCGLGMGDWVFGAASNLWGCGYSQLPGAANLLQVVFDCVELVPEYGAVVVVAHIDLVNFHDR